VTENSSRRLRRRGGREAIGDGLLSDHIHHFYTGQPPEVLGACLLHQMSHVLIQLFGRGIACPPSVLYDTPLGYCRRDILYGLKTQFLEDHIRLHMMHPDHRAQSPEELTEDLISLVRAYLK